MTLLTAKGIYKEHKINQKSLANTNLTIHRESRLGIVGETGSGKSTLLKILAGLEQPTGGEVRFKGNKVRGPQEQLVAGHPAIAYLAQHFELRKFVTVEECIYSPYAISEAEAYEIYKACDIEHLVDRKTNELSGGEKQRVALAVLLAKKPEALLLDEPFSNLDPHHKSAIKQVINNIENQLGTTVVLVAHDPVDILSWANEVLVMKSGKIIQKSTPKQIYDQPKDKYVAGLFGRYNLIKPEKWELKDPENFTTISGKVIVRPHYFSLEKARSKGIEGRITKSHYMGSHDELTVKTVNEEIVCYGGVDEYDVGDRVSVIVNR